MRLALGVLLTGCAIVPVPPRAVTGTVRTTQGEPIAGATVELRMSLWTPLCCNQQSIVQLTRTGPDGSYRFAAGADRDFHFAVEVREYSVVALHERFKAAYSYPAELSQPVDLVLEGKNATWDWTDYDCSELHFVGIEDLRRAAEFHFGDKTRCDAWYDRL